MLGTNDTPFAAIGFEQAHRDGVDMGVLAVRGSYELSPDGMLSLANDQAIVLVDEYEGDPHKTPLLRASNLVPFKPGTDVTLVGNAYAPGGAPTERWTASVSVGPCSHAVRVSGPRGWTEQDGRLVAGAPEPAAGIALDWRFAWSDLAEDERADGPVPPLNPIGMRRPSAASGERRAAEPSRADRLAGDPARGGDPLPVPLIVASDEDNGDPHAERVPSGFGPVPPFWRWRQRHAGTYDDDWLAHRHPQLPPDFDYRFYQTAPPELVVPRYLNGDEEIRLEQLLPGRDRFAFRLPAIQPVARYEWRDGREVMLRCNLDGVHMDFRSPPMRVDLTWRAWLPVCPSFFAIHLGTRPLDDPTLDDLPRSGLHGIEGIDEFGRAVEEASEGPTR